MSAITIFVNDTITSCDTVFVKFADATNVCQPVSNEAATDKADIIQAVLIALFICVAVVVIVRMVKNAVLSWKRQENEANKEEREFKKEKEQEESARKQIAELIGKKIQFLSGLCHDESEVTEIIEDAEDKNDEDKNNEEGKTNEKCKNDEDKKNEEGKKDEEYKKNEEGKKNEEVEKEQEPKNVKIVKKVIKKYKEKNQTEVERYLKQLDKAIRLYTKEWSDTDEDKG